MKGTENEMSQELNVHGTKRLGSESSSAYWELNVLGMKSPQTDCRCRVRIRDRDGK